MLQYLVRQKLDVNIRQMSPGLKLVVNICQMSPGMKLDATGPGKNLISSQNRICYSLHLILSIVMCYNNQNYFKIVLFTTAFIYKAQYSQILKTYSVQVQHSSLDVTLSSYYIFFYFTKCHDQKSFQHRSSDLPSISILPSLFDEMVDHANKIIINFSRISTLYKICIILEYATSKKFQANL